jgi:lysyl-tRNA synthetase class 2
MASLRRFFAERGVLEVETPALSAAAVTDLHLHSVACRLDADDRPLYLQTSPEYAMKRLLAAGSGAIYQICKVFRDGERGRRHNPEFTMLEWYRPGWDHHRLMDEVDDLLQAILGVQPGERVSFGDAFRRHAGVDPHAASDGELRSRVAALGVAGLAELDRDDLLNLLLSHVVEPHLGCGRPSFLFDYPASQAALARVRPGDPPVAERFEVFIDGLELANGFHELADPGEQRLRFEAALAERRRGLPEVAWTSGCSRARRRPARLRRRGARRRPPGHAADRHSRHRGRDRFPDRPGLTPPPSESPERARHEADENAVRRRCPILPP